MDQNPHLQVTEPCRCLVCRGIAQGIVLDAAYRLKREFKPEIAHKLIKRIQGELGTFRDN